MSIFYKKGFKYQLSEDYMVYINIFPEEDIHTKFIDLSISGLLYIKSGYAWDGASGPAIDTKTIMRGSLIHDALYELMRLGFLPNRYKHQADLELVKACAEDGMMPARREWILYAVETFAKRYTDERHRRKTYKAP